MTEKQAIKEALDQALRDDARSPLRLLNPKPKALNPLQAKIPAWKERIAIDGLPAHALI